MLAEVKFLVADYIVCALAVCVSISIGLYYACSGGRQVTTAEYHLGNRNLNFLPVMFSLMVTSQSSILILGAPAETYLYGFLATFIGFGFWFAYWLGARIIIPVVHPLRITSVNEGGIKAVIWTDVIQYWIMLASVLAVLIQGSLKVGGGSEVIRINSKGNRLDIWNFSLDPTLRYTIWSSVIGNTAKIGFFPFAQSSILPTLVTEIFQDTPGMTGLFIAGLLCASLSTVSSGYAVISSMTLQDILKMKWPNLSEKRSTIASKLTVLVISISTTVMALVLANIKGTLVKLAQMVMTIPTAPYTGIILYSIFCTSATSAGAIAGGIISMMFYLWMAIGNIVVSPPSVETKLAPAPLDMCSVNSTMVSYSERYNVSSYSAGVSNPDQSSMEGFNQIYGMSFQWFDFIAIILVFVVGLITSKIVGSPKEEDVDARYVLCFTEQFFPYLPEKVKHLLSCRSTIPKRRKQIKAEERQDKKEIIVLHEQNANWLTGSKW
uniref:Sodium-coupled monocarboxylate transporter 1 n=1 Tax=Magallana gigas TaxID=29159 RepID=K1PNP3_MAGGI